MLFGGRAAITMLAGVLLASCGSSGSANPTQPPQPVARLNESFTLAIGQTAVLEDVPLRITFDNVVSDSRCPVDVVCANMAAGSVTITVSVALSGKPAESLTLSTESVPTSRGDYNGYEIALERIQPDAYSNRPIPPGAYRATLRVSPQP